MPSEVVNSQVERALARTLLAGSKLRRSNPVKPPFDLSLMRFARRREDFRKRVQS